MKSLITILVSLTIAEMMFAMGLRLSFTVLIISFRQNSGVVYRAILANYVIVPLVAIWIIGMYHVLPYAAIGLLILGVSPAAPYGPPFTSIARGNLAIATGLMVILAGLSAFMAPLLLHLLLPQVAPDELSFRIDPGKLAGTLFAIQLLPLCLGLAIGEWRPAWASFMRIPASHVSKVLNLLMITAIAILQLKVLAGIRTPDLTVILILIAAGAASGWFLGWPGRENRVSIAMITAMRNMSLSMGIAVTSFPDSPVITTVLAFSFIAGISLLLFAFLLRQL